MICWLFGCSGMLSELPVKLERIHTKIVKPEDEPSGEGFQTCCGYTSWFLSYTHSDWLIRFAADRPRRGTGAGAERCAGAWIPVARASAIPNIPLSAGAL